MVRMFARFMMIFTVAFTVMACGADDKPVKVAKDYFTQIEKGNIDGMFDLMDMSDVSQEELNMIKPKFEMMATEMANEFKKQGGVKAMTFGEAEYNDDKTMAKVRVTAKDASGGDDIVDMITLKKVNGKWKIAQ